MINLYSITKSTKKNIGSLDSNRIYVIVCIYGVIHSYAIDK